jgi:hypothetical protein
VSDFFSSRQRPQPKAKGSRGQPVIVLAVVLGAWTLLRAATWVGLPTEDPVAATAGSTSTAELQAYSLLEERQASEVSLPETARRAADAATGGTAPDPVWPAIDRPYLAPRQPTVAPPTSPAATTPVSPQLQPAAPAARPANPRAVAGHTLLMAAGFAQMELPPQIAAWFNALPHDSSRGAPLAETRLAEARSASAPSTVSRSAGSQRRWSADGWLLWRDDSSSPLLTGRPSYGRSQAGAVVRYHLAPSSRHRPQAYLRGSTALQGAREQEAALGLSARLLANVPVRLAAEMRASERTGGTSLRPAAYAVTELPPQALGGGLVAEGYAAAGYVGGRAATTFVDGQARIDRSLASADDFDLRAGGGAWGGAQRDAARLDIGPTASLSFRVGETRARVAADYRVRVAGDARPTSGPALTLSAGF